MTTNYQLERRVAELEAAMFRLATGLSCTHLLAVGSHNEDADARGATDHYVKEIHRVQGEQGETIGYIKDRVIRINHAVDRTEQMVKTLTER